MDNCIFCKIAAKQIPSSVVYEDEDLLAFKDINPAAPVHILIIPKKHIATLSDADAQDGILLGKMLALAPKIAKEQGCDVQTGNDGQVSGGYKTLVNTGPDGGQEVYHLHIHVIGGPKPWRGQR
ncbi:histidine triad nucleotide-binding protein [Undibacterium sp.]|uniref:histidine triad nucleotide-binding protein n=1 Tax=Undibacterium sp. TaxID=1914977 RepID=UPI00374D9987